LDYWSNNVGGLLSLLRSMRRNGCASIVFSSSATVYGEPQLLPIAESAPLRATSPYGSTKLTGETILDELRRAEPHWRVAVLRYFNPVGAHSSGMLGEDPNGAPNNLMPFVAQVAVGRRAALRVFGCDYPTADGTGVRDYIHVEDLAEGHVAALRALQSENHSFTVNLGTGHGTSVFEVVSAFERASRRRIALELAPRRAGDVAACWADPTLAHTTLGWQARHDLDRMCEDTWRWQSRNPEGYAAHLRTREG
jgi:UDP-glucose 4-epimerase